MRYTIRLRRLFGLFSMSFLLAVSTALLAYTNSTYLAEKFDANFVGYIFTFGSLITFIAIHYFSKFILKVGKMVSFLILLVFQLVLLLLLSSELSGGALFMAFALYMMANALIWVNIDILVEAFSTDAATGRIRGGNLTITNLGYVVSPIVAGFLVEKYGFDLVFVVSALITLPMIIFALRNIKDNNDIHFSKPKPFFTVLAKIFTNPHLRSIYYIAFLLYFFYAVMVIYTPIHLVEGLGLTWGQVGQIFTVMLLPFVILEYIVGYLADRFFGEAEMLTLGIVVMSVATFMLFYVHSFIGIMITLFMTRVGASMVEILRDSYFYKQVDGDDIDLIDYFRSTGPLAYILAPLVATIILSYVTLPYIFIFLSGLILTGLFASVTMPDTK